MGKSAKFWKWEDDRMNRWMKHDLQNQQELLELALGEAKRFLTARPEAPVNPIWPADAPRADPLPQEGLGAQGALELFQAKYAPYVPACSGPRFHAYTVGGNTPASMVGDWLTSTYDLNAMGVDGGVDGAVERETLDQLRQLIGLPASFVGQFTPGATLANVVGMAVAREWAAQAEGKSADDGIYGLKRPTVLTGLAHGSVYKGLSMLGLGRNAVVSLPCVPGTESVEVAAVEEYLKGHPDEKCIVIANMGTASTGDVDDLPALAALKDRYDFYLHVEGAIAAVAASSPKLRGLFGGMERSDSLVLDCHKWLNAPYECAAVFVNGPTLREYQHRIFAQAGSVTAPLVEPASFTSMGPEGSRRWRALPVWFSLRAYGQEGFAEMAERDCAMAKLLGEELERSGLFRVVNRVQVNIVSFVLLKDGQPVDRATRDRFLDILRKNGETFFSAGTLEGTPLIRGTICKWMVEEEDIHRCAKGLIAAGRETLG